MAIGHSLLLDGGFGSQGSEPDSDSNSNFQEAWERIVKPLTCTARGTQNEGDG